MLGFFVHCRLRACERQLPCFIALVRCNKFNDVLKSDHAKCRFCFPVNIRVEGLTAACCYAVDLGDGRAGRAAPEEV